MVDVLGHRLISFYHQANAFFQLVRETLATAWSRPLRVKQTFEQLHFVGNESVLIVVFCVSFAAMVVIIEASFHMKIVIQNDALVPGFAALLIVRELGAVITGLLLTSRIGAGIAAEVGSMKITEQLEALKLLGIDRISFIVVPRLIACTLGGMALSLIANVICVLCAMFITLNKLDYGVGNFLSALRTFVEFQDLIFAAIKGAAFGAIIPLVGCYYGFKCELGAEGVGRATTETVVTASVLIIIVDFLLTYLFSYFY